METDRPGTYRPRRPRASPLWQCVNRHLPELRATGRVRRAVEGNVLERFLECGDLHCGFARIRPFFAYRRSLLGELCRIVARLLVEAHRAAHPRSRPGFILFVQTFGDLVNFNPHVHALVADGVFEASGRFIPLLPISEALLAERLRREVIRFLVRRELILPPQEFPILP